MNNWSIHRNILIFIAVFVVVGWQHSAIQTKTLWCRSSKVFLGSIEQYHSVQHTFDLSNNASEDIIIEDVITSCACTQASIDISAISQGTIAHLKVTVNPLGRVGRFSGRVDVKWRFKRVSSPVQEVSLFFEANATYGISIFPAQIDFGTISSAQPEVVRSLSIINGNAKLLWDNIKIITSRTPIQIKKRDINIYSVRLSLNPRELPIGNYSDKIQIFLEDQGRTVGGPFIVPILAHIITDLIVRPSVIYIGLIHVGAVATGDIIIVSPPGHSIAIVSIQPGTKQITFQTNSKANAESYKISYRMDPGVVRGNLSGVANIHIILDGTDKILKLPYLCYVQ